MSRALSLRPGPRHLPALREIWYRLRDRLLGSARFQHAAARFPLTRPVARRRAGELFALSAGFVYSQTLFACVRLRLMERVADGPLPAPELAAQCDMPLEGMQRLLDAAAALRLLQRRGDNGYGLGDLGAAMLANPGIAAMVDHHSHLYADLADPVAMLRERGPTHLSAYWPYALEAPSVESGSGHAAPAPAASGLPASGLPASGLPASGPIADAARVAAYSELMASSQAMLAQDVLDAFPLRGCRQLLDVAGGQGAFAAAALARYPQLAATVFDLPAVAERASARLQQLGFGDRALAVGGDMFGGELPAGAEVISLVRVLHDHDDGPVRALLRRVHAALPPGGRLLVAEPMAGTRGAEAIGDAYFGLYLWAMGSGRPRSRETLMEMIREAGFSHCRERRTSLPLLVRVLEATR